MQIGFPGILFLIFLVLKLLGKITWSWWWVTSPLWISAGLGILILCGIFTTALLLEYAKEKKRRA